MWIASLCQDFAAENPIINSFWPKSPSGIGATILDPADPANSVRSTHRLTTEAWSIFINSDSERTKQETVRDIHSHFQAIALERREGELLTNIQEMLEAVHHSATFQFFKFVVYLSSNNHLSDDKMDEIVSWIARNKKHSLLVSLLSIQMPTIEAFAENLFRSALRVKDTDTVQIALQAGVNPNSPMGWDRITPDRIRTVTLGSNFTVRIFCQVSFCQYKIGGLELIFSVVDLDFRAAD